MARKKTRVRRGKKGAGPTVRHAQSSHWKKTARPRVGRGDRQDARPTDEELPFPRVGEQVILWPTNARDIVYEHARGQMLGAAAKLWYISPFVYDPQTGRLGSSIGVPSVGAIGVCVGFESKLVSRDPYSRKKGSSYHQLLRVVVDGRLVYFDNNAALRAGADAFIARRDLGEGVLRAVAEGRPASP